jgi:integration host factor subunit alpha
MTITKATLATTLFEQLGLNKREANDMVDRFFEEVAAALEAGDFVKLSGFGNFTLREKPPRPGRNPKTGQPIPISARHGDLSRQFTAEGDSGPNAPLVEPGDGYRLVTIRRHLPNSPTRT